MTSVSGDVAWGTACGTGSNVTIPGGTTTYSWTLNAPFAGQWIYLENFYDAGGTQLSGWVQDERGTSDTGWTRSGSPPAGAVTLCVRVWWGWGNSSPGTWTGTVTFGSASVSSTACPYGTQLSEPGKFVYYLTPGLIDLILTSTGEVWAVPFLTALYLSSVDAQTLCSTGPPTPPVLTIQDFVGPSSIATDPDFLGKLWQWFLARAWNYFCTCSPAPPGSPEPLPYPAPSQTQPTGTPEPILFQCDETDVCTILNQFGLTLAGIQQNLRAIRGQVDLIQRARVPFAYVPGTLHSGLTGAGQFAVQGILGLAVQVTTVPGASGEEAGDPIARWGLGWVTTGTPDGWRKSVPIRHNPQWVDVEPDDTLVGYSLEPLVVANIEEFVREP